MTHRQAILRDLKRGQVLTHLSALQKYGCARLAARINELRPHYPVRSKLVSRNGKRFAEYWL
jgi:hypothetical protein